MTVNFPLLVLALVLLWVPRRWLRLGRVLFKRRSHARERERMLAPSQIREPGDPRVDMLAEFAKVRNYVDLIRAAVGGVCIMGGLRVAAGLHVEACLTVAPDAPASQAMALLALKSLILLIGLLVQTLRYEKQRFTFYPPIFFLAGLSVSLCTPWAALFAFVAIWAMNPALGNAQGFLAVYALLMGAFGAFFIGSINKGAILAGLLCLLPVLLSLLANRPLVILTRKSTHEAGATS